MSGNPSPDQIRLDQIRARHNEASFDWTHEVSGRRHPQLCARLLKGTPKVAVVTMTEDCGYQDEAFLTNAHADIGFLLAIYKRLVERLASKSRELALYQGRDAPKNYAAECAMKCKEPAFKKFLEERHGLERPLTDERVNTRVRSLLKVSSRGKLNEDTAAATRWRDLRDEFDAWRQHG